MRKILAVLFACSIVLAGCMGLSDDDVDEIVDAVVDLPGCNDATAYNYDENASNNLTCFTEAILKESVTEFVNLLNSDGAEWGETVGIMTESTETDSDGETASFTSTGVTSPDGTYFHIEMDMGMMVIEMGELMTENPDGTTNIVSNWMGNSFQMNTEVVFDEFYNAESFADLQNDSADDSNDDGGSDDFDLGLPDTDVSIPDEFNPADALYEAGLATDNGYAFTTTLNIDDYTNVMTFILSSEFKVTELRMDETWMDGSSAVSVITVLDDATASALLTKDESLIEHALPFSVEPMGGMDDHDDHDDHNDDHDDHDDEIYWNPYYGGYCEWEGNPEDDDNVWSCKDDASNSYWDDWWWYCELHGDDWFCTDNLGQDPEHENSAGNSQYDHTEDGHDEEDVFFDAYLTDNYASIDDQYVNPEFSVYSGFDIIVEVDFELLDSDGNQITSVIVYPTDFSETTDGYMVYYFPLSDESLADGCYTLIGLVTTSTDQIHHYERYDICINTHSEGDETTIEVDAIEEQYSTVAELYEAWGDVLSTGGANCVGCEGNLAAMTADSTIDITDQASFESVAGMYDDYYFQFIDENGNGMYDAEEIYAVSCENVDGDDEQRAVVAYDGGYYANYEDSGAYMFEQFWSDAYDFSWSTSDSGNNDNSDNHDDGQGDGDGHDNGDNHDDGDGHDNGDDHSDEMSTDDYLQMIDQDEDGMVSWDEFEDFIINHDGGWADDQDRSDTYDHFNYTDDNADGYLDYDEFSNWIDSIDIGHGDDDGHDDGDNHDDGHGDDHSEEMDDEDGMLSEEDFFAAADSDNDGLVSSQDIIDAVMAGDAPTPQEALDEGDVDNSEGISWDEFVAMWNADEDEGDDQHLDYNAELKSAFNDAFNNSDVDSTGELSIDELQAFIDEVVSIASTDEEDDDGEFASMIDMMVNCVDDDGDGLLDQMEFSTFYTNLDSGGDSIAMAFCMFDTDGNDLVTASEYAAYMNQSGFYGDEPMSDEDWAGFVSMFSYYDVDDIEGLDIVEFEDMMSSMSDDDDDHGDHDHGDHHVQLDWQITSTDMLTPDIEVAGSFADYHIVLASCTMDGGPDEDGNMDPTDMLETNAMTCGEDVMKVSMAQATSVGADIMFHDVDGSGTITEGDMIHINPDLEAGDDWNMVRLYSEPADNYSDENPMLPGFGALAGIIALLGAALLTRRD